MKQFETCAKEAEAALPCADHHPGYSQPIGGAVAYEHFVSLPHRTAYGEDHHFSPQDYLDEDYRPARQAEAASCRDKWFFRPDGSSKINQTTFRDRSLNERI